MASAALSDYTAVHRDLWRDSRVLDESYAKMPFFGMMKKKEDFREKTKYVPLQYGRPQGRSRTFATAQTRKTAARFEAWGLKRVSDYGYSEFEGELLEAVKGNPEAMVSAFDKETKSALANLKRSLHINMFGSGAGDRGQILNPSGITEASPAAGQSTIELAEHADIKNFEVGMYVTAGATLTGALRDTGAAYEILGVDVQAGTFFVDGLVTTTSAWAVDDFLFADGDAQNGATLTGVPGTMLAGLRGWIPSTAPTPGDDWFGVDRSADVVRLAGWRFSLADLATPTTKRAAIQRAAAIMDRGGLALDPDTVIMNGEDYGAFLEEIDEKNTVIRVAGDSRATIAFKGIEIHTALGTPLTVFADSQCPKGRAYILRMDTWTFHSLGMAPKFIEEDGQRILRVANSDAYEFRLVARGNIACEAPVYNGTLVLP